MGTDQSTLKGGDTSRMSQQELRDRRINRLDNSTREKLSRVQDLNLKITIRGARRYTKRKRNPIHNTKIYIQKKKYLSNSFFPS